MDINNENIKKLLGLLKGPKPIRSKTTKAKAKAKTKKPKLTRAEINLIRRANYRLKKRGTKYRISRRKIREMKGRRSRKEIYSSIKTTTEHAVGLAYPNNIGATLEYYESMGKYPKLCDSLRSIVSRGKDGNYFYKRGGKGLLDFALLKIREIAYKKTDEGRRMTDAQRDEYMVQVFKNGLREIKTIYKKRRKRK